MHPICSTPQAQVNDERCWLRGLLNFRPALAFRRKALPAHRSALPQKHTPWGVGHGLLSISHGSAVPGSLNPAPD